MKRVLNMLVDALIFLVFLVSLLVVTMALTSRSTGLPNLAGFTMFTVQTDSMEPVIMPGDLMISRVANDNDTYEIGDVITFRTFVDRTQILNSHRVVEIQNIEGIEYYITQGDNTAGQDDMKITAGDVVAKWTGIRLGGVGTVMDFLRSPKGFFICVLLPMILFFLYVLYQFVVNLVEYNKEKAIEAAKAATAELSDEQKRKAVEEYLAAQGQNNQGSGSADT